MFRMMNGDRYERGCVLLNEGEEKKKIFFFFEIFFLFGTKNFFLADGLARP